MDLLRKELERKKQTLAKAKEVAGAGASSSGDGNTKRKYLKVSDLRRIEEKEQEENDRKRWKKQRKRDKKSNNSTMSVSSSSSSSKKSDQNKTSDEVQIYSNKKSKIESNSDSQKASSSSTSTSLSLTEDLENSPASITRKLRQMGLVIRYFGEGNTMRLERLKKALEQQSKTLEGLSELEEFRLGQEHRIRNPFLDRDKSNTQNQQQLGIEETSADKARNETAKNKKDQSVDIIEVEKEEDPSDHPKVIYKYLKMLLKEWERELANRPESITRSVAGRNESKTLKQCKDYIRPLFKLLKSRKLEDGLQFHLLKIVNFAKQGEFVQAHDSYIDMAIGRAAWPIGVTMVGIHARSGRAKIESSNVAHVMNSEFQRKYLTSVKRLLTFDQKRRTDVNPSKKVT
jgi:pre-mRNA-splicing factor 18